MARRTLLSHFADLPDPRVDRTKMHRLDEILLMSVGHRVVETLAIKQVAIDGKSLRGAKGRQDLYHPRLRHEPQVRTDEGDEGEAGRPGPHPRPTRPPPRGHRE